MRWGGAVGQHEGRWSDGVVTEPARLGRWGGDIWDEVLGALRPGRPGGDDGEITTLHPSLGAEMGGDHCSAGKAGDHCSASSSAAPGFDFLEEPEMWSAEEWLLVDGFDFRVEPEEWSTEEGLLRG